MAATYPPSAAFDFCKIMVKNMRLQDIEVRALDAACKSIWTAAPWRWTIGVMPPFAINSNVQDYTVTYPADFLYLYRVQLTDGTTITRTLFIEPILPNLSTSSVWFGNPAFCAQESTNKIRLMPIPGNLSKTTNLMAWYKKAAPLITSGNQGTAGVLVMDDDWFQVYCEFVLYHALRYADDQDAGAVRVDPLKLTREATGQLAVAWSALAEMKEREKLMINFDPASPDQPLLNK